MRLRRVVTLCFVILACRTVAHAQIIEMKQAGDNQVMCVRSGLFSSLNDCGTRSDWYTYVFVGRISAVTPAADDEKELLVVPEEVFLGTPPNPLPVMTSQAYCIDDVEPGDRWLFYLRKEEGKPVVIDLFGTESLPVVNAQEQITTLRRLQQIGDLGLLRGHVTTHFPDGEPVKNAQITAIRKADGMHVACVSHQDGRYEFPPLPEGEYDVSVGGVASDQPDDSSIEIVTGGCWDMGLYHVSKAQISGDVRLSDGRPAVDAGVLLLQLDGESMTYNTHRTDSRGHFEFSAQQPGDYLIGIDFPVEPNWFGGGGGGGNDMKLPPVSLFYPGVSNRSAARLIHLRADEKFDVIDLVVPAK